MKRKALIALVCVILTGCLFITVWHLNAFNRVTDYLYGPTGDIYSPREMVWWLWLFTPLWVTCGQIIDKSYEGICLRLYRTGSRRRWWYRLCGAVFCVNLIYFGLFILLLNTKYGLYSMKSGLTAVFLQMCHSAWMLCLALWLWLYTKRISASFIMLIVLESVSKMFVMLGIRPVYCPFVWGMYGYSDACREVDGFNIGIAAGLMIVSVFLTWYLPVRVKFRNCMP